MLLNRLVAKNFKRYRDQEITFRDGVTGIVGNNGAGKSTIVEATLFALYGVRGLGKNESEFIVRSSAGPRERCEVRLDFHTGGHEYTVVRTFKKGKASVLHEAQLHMEGALLADGVTAVDQEMHRVIGMGAEDFKHTIFAGQKDLLSILDETPGERKKWFMRVLGIDTLKNESDAILRGEIQQKERELGLYEMRMEELDADEITSRLERTSGDLDLVRREISDLEVKKSDLAQHREALGEQKEQLEARDVQRRDLIRSKQNVEAKLEDYEQELSRMKREYEELMEKEAEFRQLSSVEEEYSRLKRASDENSRKEKRFESLSGDLRVDEEALRQLKDRKERLSNELGALVEDAKTCDELAPVIERRTRLKDELQVLREREPTYLGFVSKRDQARERFKGIEDRVRGVLDDIVRLEEDPAAKEDPDMLAARISGTEQEREELLSRQSAVEEQRRTIQQDREELSTNLREILAAGERGMCPTCHRPLGDHFSSTVEEFRALLEEMGTRDTGLEAEQSQIEGREKDLHATLETLKGSLAKAETVRAKLGERHSERESLMGEAEGALLQLGESEDQIARLGYDPEQRRTVETGIANTDVQWTALIEARDRLKGREEKQIELKGIVSQMSVKEGEIEQVRGEIALLGFEPDEFSRIRQDYREAEGRYHRFLKMKEQLERLPVVRDQRDEKQKRISAEAASLEKINADLADLADIPEEMERLGQKIDANSREIESVRNTMVDLRVNYAGLTEKKDKCNRDLEKLREYESSIKTLVEEIGCLKQTRELLGEYFMYLLNVVRDRIEGEVGRVLGEITDGRYDNVLIDESFTVLVNDMGDNFPAHRFSGGEQDDIAIALRIALSHYLAEMHQIHDSTFLIFDEIFGSQDEGRRNNLIQALRTQETHFPQIFLISHVTDMQGEFSNTLLVDMGEGDESIVRELSG